jgi:energy-coupling factor transporter ATP-binding protein EcfA2
MTKIIGLSGKKRSGKDTLAGFLAQLMPHTVCVAFADALKNEVAQATGFTREYMEEHKDNFRLILQGWGTDFRRKLCGEDYWIHRTVEQINWLRRLPVPPALIIVTDCRFKNEAETVRQLGGLMVRVVKIGSASDDAHAPGRLAQENGLRRIALGQCVRLA